MSGAPPDDPDGDDDRTVIIPSGRAPPSTPVPRAEDNEPTVVPGGRAPSSTPASQGDDYEPTQIIGRTPDKAQGADDLTRIIPVVPDGELAPGTILGNYRVGKPIGRGGLGAIYAGVNVYNPAERVAIKTILPDPEQGERFDKMLLDEANALMRVRHDAVVPYRTYGRVSANGAYYLVLEFIDGDPLNDFYRRRKLNETELFALGRRIAEGLQASHAEGLVHRDLSPDNILLPQSQLDGAIIIDFGIAKVGDFEEASEALFAGKLSYAAPEQFERGARIGPWTDGYSLALVLIAAARGAPVPMGKDLESARAARRVVPPLDGVPERLHPVLSRMLQPDPRERPQTMREAIRLFDEAERAPIAAPVAQATPIAAAPAAQRPGRVSQIKRTQKAAVPVKRRRNSGLVSGFLALLVGGGIAAGVAVFQDDLFGKSSGGQQPVAQLTPTPQPSPSAAPTPAPTPVPTPLPTPDPAAAQAAAAQAVAERLSPLGCSLTRVTATGAAPPFAIAVAGVWADELAVRAAAGPDVQVNGQTLERALCPVLEGLRKIVPSLGPAVLSQPETAADGTVTVTLSPDPQRPALYLLEISPEGAVVPLLDLSTPEQTAAAIATGAARAMPGGRIQARLRPWTSAALLVAVSGYRSLPFAAPAGPLGFDTWLGSVAGTPAADYAVDLVQRPPTQMAPSPEPTAAPTPEPTPSPGPTPTAAPTPSPEPTPAATPTPEPTAAPTPSPSPEPTAAPTPEPTPGPTSGPTPPIIETTSGVDPALAATFAAVECSLIRLAPDGSGGVVASGVWGKSDKVKAAAAPPEAVEGAPPPPATSLNGEAVSAAYCATLDALKVGFNAAAPLAILAPAPVNEGKSETVIVTDPAFPNLTIFAADPAGRVLPVINLGDAAAVAARVAMGDLADDGGGRFRLTLPRYSPAASPPALLLIAVFSSRPMATNSAMTAKDFADLVAAAGAVRTDATAYRQAP